MLVYVSKLDKDYFDNGEKAVAYQHKPVLVETIALDIVPQQVMMQLGVNRVLIVKDALVIKKPVTE